MRDFHLDVRPLLTSDTVQMLTAIHECKGKQDLHLIAHQDALSTLLDIAKIQSIGASNRIEGIYTSNARLHALAMDLAEPQTRSEEEIAGYRMVLEMIHERYDAISITPSVLLQLHRDLYAYSAYGTGGHWKSADNAIEEVRADGTKGIRFQPIAAFETPEAVQRLCDAFAQKSRETKDDPLLLFCMFLVDFLCIHPFNDGNGRLSRLLTLLMLYRHDYTIGKYISLETLIEKSKETYYEALQASSVGWHEGKNDYAPFTRYMLGILLAAYRDFNNRVASMQDKSRSKPERIRQIFTNRLDALSRNDLMMLCPDISESTLRHTLTQLVKEGFIVKVGSARATRYVRKS